MEERTPGEARYRAFVSYSHRDQAFGRRLHRWLERYAVPRRLVGRVTARGTTPKRVAPVFRDREELSAAHDLTAEIREALANSGALIVVCTPNAAASPWVAREIELFRELHPDRPVLAALADGEPAEAFPAPLTMTGDARAEPLAADFRQTGDGPRLALLKLVAGVLGLGLDELIQRDAQRRLRGVMAVTGAAVAAGVVLSALTTYALIARAEAQRQRAEAEALVEFMLTDLRDRLKGVGRLDVLTAVNERTLEYYARQNVERLSGEGQARYARILMAMGEDDLSRGDDEAAFGKFRTAGSITEAQLDAAPKDPARIWAHGQSEYWLGYHAYRRDDRVAANASWRRYRLMAIQLVSVASQNPKYLRELAYAEGNLCTLALKKPAVVADALKHCEAALAVMKRVADLSPADRTVARDLINRHAWMAQAFSASGNLQNALAERSEQERLLKAALDSDPNNMRLESTWLVLQRELSSLEVRLGERQRAHRRVLAARQEIDALLAHDPANADWAEQRDRLEVALQYFENTSKDRSARKKSAPLSNRYVSQK
ncbi:toll/interleukin-1 receptor domain-containing protein [Phenylobacterium kunshanense]|uniref:TIR domain-containing protein n=1 Tax=Phenylobacterium kunshanense TaxID=1445034 RepID=A0A328BF67_9CAUL|nr:toll/interleukin-1 receptor domain-containing protein [Phenylobacterium kunshanense]RAK63738.1 hypothetical protein DJ019_15920 [Phenylobacterium kunshanense]